MGPTTANTGRQQVCFLLQAVRITLADCQYSLYDWPAAQHKCVPKYDENKRGLDQQLPVFELPPDSYFVTAEAAADAGFAKLEQDGPKI